MGNTIPGKVTERPPFDDGDPKTRYDQSSFDLVELKMDGIWCRLECKNFIDKAGLEKTSLTYYSRHGQLKFARTVPAVACDGVVLHGEFMFGSNWGISRGLDKKLFVFDCTRSTVGAIDKKPLWYRRNVASAYVALLSQHTQDIALVPQHHSGKVPELWANEVMKQGYEGLILKQASGTFGSSWVRIKRAVEVDYVCMGFEQSDAVKYKGCMVKSVIAGLFEDGKIKRVAQISGLTDDQRAEFFNNPQRYEGRVFVASGKRVFESGALRHPSFERWHSEKTPSECTVEKARKVGGLSSHVATS